MKRFSQQNHDAMVLNAARFLTSKGYRNVKADLPGATAPDRIFWKSTNSGHTPDITAENGRLMIVEVETSDSISDAHTEDQWKLFSAFVNQHGGEFWVAVPKGSENAAQIRLNNLNLNAKVWAV